MSKLWTPIIFVIGLIFSPGLHEALRGQGQFANYFDSDSFWRSVAIIDKDAVVDGKVDTQVAVVSNRVFDYRVLRFAKEESESNGSLHYFLAFMMQGKWSIKPCNNLPALLQHLNRDQGLVVYTEGYGKHFISGLFRAFAMRAQYKVNVLYLDYPSINRDKRKLGNWRFVLKEANKAGTDFAPVLDSLYQYQLSKNYFPTVTLFYHSMGNLALKRMLQEDLFSGFNNSVWVDNLVLNAACVPAKNYEQWLGKAKFARNILIHYNPEDKTLKGAQLISGNRKIGVRPGREMPDNTVCVNFNRFVGDGHSYFLNLPYRAPLDKQVAHYMKEVLHGRMTNVRDSLVFRRLDGEGKYELVE